ncbi:hypothetical protein [Cellulomonas iranensis]|uniref:hypothetical protein n=1 Tax=Cellulomonas iranensis TaxID=76862 RepID=UPI0013D30210|nr:hypothetical protein [Cellulomonas iranensis]
MAGQRDLTAHSIRTSTAASAGVMKLAAAVIFFALWLIVAAPIGDRRAGVPEDPQSESAVTRGLQWLSAWAWGLLLAPAALATVAFSVAPLLGVVVAPLLLLSAPAVLGRRAAAARGVWMPGRVVLRALAATVRTSRVAAVVVATVVVAPLAALAAWHMDQQGVTRWAALIGYSAWILLAGEALRCGMAYGDAELDARAADAADIDLLAALPGVTHATAATAGTRLIPYDDGGFDVVDLPEPARLRIDDVAAALEARFPDLYAAEVDGPAGCVRMEPLTEEVLAARELAATTHGLVAAVLATTDPDDDTDVLLDLRAGLNVKEES